MAAHSGKLPFATKALYGSGTVAFGVKDQGFSALLMLYYNQVLGLPAAWVGAAIMVAMIADALFDPFLGQISDDFRSRWGRRHPFMYASALPIGLFYFLVWQPPAGLSDQLLFAYLVVVSIIVRWSISLYEIPSTALLAEFSSDYDERTKLVSHRFFFGAVGGVAMGIAAFGYFLRPDAAHAVGQLNPAGYHAYAVAAAVIMTAFVLLSAVGTHNRIPTLVQPPKPERTPLSQTLKHMLSVLLNPAYTTVLLASFFIAMSQGLHNALSIYLTTYFWTFTSSQIATLTAMAFVGMILAFVVVLPLSARFGKKQTAMVLYTVSLAASTAPLVLRLLGVLPPNGDPALFALIGTAVAITYMSAIAASILAVSMVADVTERVQLSTGKRAEGLMFSMATMINKAVSGMGIFASGLLLTVVQFPERASPGAVPAETLNKLAIMQIGGTVTLSLLAIAFIAFYPISRADHMDTVARLRAAAE